MGVLELLLQHPDDLRLVVAGGRHDDRYGAHRPQHPQQLGRGFGDERIEVGQGTFSAWWTGKNPPQHESPVHALETIFRDKGVPAADIRLVELYWAAKEAQAPGPSGKQKQPPSDTAAIETTPDLSRQQDRTPPPPASEPRAQPSRASLGPVGWTVIGLVTALLLGLAGGTLWFRTRESRTKFDRALQQLESPDASERRTAVRTIEELAPRSAAQVGQACGELVTLIRTRQKPPSSDPPMSEVPTLEERSPDAHAAVHAISQLRCVGQGEGVHLNEVDLRKAQLRHTYFPGAGITWSDLRQLNLSGARLEDARLVGSNLDYANLEEANLADAELRGARMEGVRLRRANLQRADLGSDLTSGRRVYLAAADLTGADLRGANLRGVNLSGGGRIGSATLRNARLEGTRLQGAVLSGVALDGATADASTEWPAGFDPAAAGVMVAP